MKKIKNSKDFISMITLIVCYFSPVFWYIFCYFPYLISIELARNKCYNITKIIKKWISVFCYMES